MLDITLVTIGKAKDKSYLSLISDYQKRSKPYLKLKIVELESLSFSEKTKDKAKEFEAERILNYLDKQKDNAAVYLLAERGEIYDSINFANWLNKKSPLILVLGGSLGFSDTLYNIYPSLSLSPLTFPHELARVVVMEQLYRAATILQKKNYHY